MPVAEDLIKRYESLKTSRATWDSFWQGLANYLQTRKAEINTRTDSPSVERNAFLYDSTAAQANMTLAQGQMSLLSPPTEQWFSFTPPFFVQDNDRAIAAFRQITEIMQRLFLASNFYTEIHEAYLQRGGFGTAAIFSDLERGEFYFRAYDIGTYCITENSRGFVDGFVREYPMTARQAVQEFGEENLPKKIVECASDTKKSDEPFQFLNWCMPREEYSKGKGRAANLPYASIHIAMDDKVIVRESGFEDFPYHVTRYLRWSDTITDPWGWCPGWTALPDIRQVNLLAQYLDTLAEVAAHPRILAPASLEGEVDLRALGITYWDPTVDRQPPTEWATQGRYDIGEDRYQKRVTAIERAFHVDLFLMFSRLEKQAQMSVLEITERASEKLFQFSPTFTRMRQELFDPLLRRCFRLAASSGMFNHIEGLEALVVQEGSQAAIIDPEIRYNSKLALALDQVHNTGIARTLELVIPASQVKPEILDAFNFMEIVKGFGRNEGVPERFFNSQAEVQALQQRREELMEAQAIAETRKADAEANARESQAPAA